MVIKKLKDQCFAFLVLATGCVMVPALAVAHHGFAVFDRANPIAVEGTVTEFHFTNPHCIIDFEVKDDKGHTQKWQAELTSPLHLKGWTATSLEPGNGVKLNGYRAKERGAVFVGYAVGLIQWDGAQYQRQKSDSGRTVS